MGSSIVGEKGQVVIPTTIRAMFHIKPGTQVHFEARHGEIVLTLRLAPRPSLDSARDRLAVGSLRVPPLTPRYFERMAGCLGTGGKATQAFLEERKRTRKL